MALDEELEMLREATLRRLPLELISSTDPTSMDPTFEVVATVPGPREEPLEEPMRESLASHLAARVSRAVEEKKGEGRRPVGIASSKVDYSDHADCDAGDDRIINAFLVGERCYRIVIRVATERA